MQVVIFMWCLMVYEKLMGIFSTKVFLYAKFFNENMLGSAVIIYDDFIFFICYIILYHFIIFYTILY